MPRIRTVKPEFFTHYDLFQAEKESGMPLRLGFQGLWLCADRDGRFRWQPPQLKLNILPYDPIDFEKLLSALVKYGFIGKYKASDGKHYGNIPSFNKHQRITGTEATTESRIPSPSDTYEEGNILDNNGNTLETTRTTRKGKGVKEKEGEMEKEKEGSGEEFPHDSLNENLCFDIEKFLLGNRKQLEIVCMNAMKTESEVLIVLRKFHLAQVEKGSYPRQPLQLIAGLQRWILNEKSFQNGTNNGTAKKNYGDKPVAVIQSNRNLGDL